MSKLQARRFRRETVMTIEWIGERLNMGSRHTIANSLKLHRKIQ